MTTDLQLFFYMQDFPNATLQLQYLKKNYPYKKIL